MFSPKSIFFALIILFFFALENFYAQEKDEVLYKYLGFNCMDYPEVETLRKKYLTTHKDWLYNILDDAESYRIYVRNELEKRGLPEILEYLPVVESDYLPTAKSKSGALGVWQFMLNSVKPFLYCDEYVDERLDVWKSTDAALKKLSDNYFMFNDWLLAITAYNCGAGALRRIIKKAGKSDFWYLSRKGYLPGQSASYVPKLLAIADVCENTEFYGVDMPTVRDENGDTINMRVGMFDYVTVKGQVSISAIAQELRIDEEEFRRLNLALVKGFTPPKSEYSIRFPEGMAGSAVYVLKKMGIKVIKTED